MKLSKLGEKKIITEISRKLRIKEDDAAWIKFKSEKITKGYIIFSTDMVYGKTHILPGMSFEQMGKLISTINLSDIAAMGAKPIAFLLSYGSRDIEVKKFNEILKGVKNQCEKFGVRYLGGDMNETDELILAGSIIGFTEKYPVLRSGAKVNDIICVTGEIGTASLGTEIITKKLIKVSKSRKIYKSIIKRAFEPQPRVKEGVILGKFANSMTDISDSLAISLYEIAEQSKVSMEIYLDKLPISEYANKISKEKLKLNMLNFALYGGGDYELLFTLKKEKINKIKNKFNFTEIGRVLKSEKGISQVVGIEEKGKKKRKIKKLGYEHFHKYK